MRRSLLAALLALGAVVAVVISSSLPHGYAQSSAPVGDEFNNGYFPPWVDTCAPLAYPMPCDPQGTGKWSINGESPGNLRIWTQPGSLLGSSNNARNLLLQPFSPFIDWTATTKLSFPGTLTTPTAYGQTAGIIVYQDADNFIYLGRTFATQGTTATSQLQFLQETAGADVATSFVEGGIYHPIVYLQIRKSGSQYTAWYCYDNCEASNAVFTQIGAGSGSGTPTPTALAGYTGSYQSPQVGLFAYGGTNTQVSQAQVPADFDWFRVGNQATPAATPPPTATTTPAVTATSTPGPTATPHPTVTATLVPTATVVPTATRTPIPTATTAPSPTPTNTPIPPTPTPTPRPPAPKAAFRYISVWWHVVRVGTREHVEVQARGRSTHGIWVHVIFPSGLHFDYYENTDSSGHWIKEFPVPRNARSRYSNQTVITFQLWKGRSTAKNHTFFTLVG